MEVRRARPEDAAAIAAVHVRTWQAAYEHVFGAERLANVDLATRIRNWERWLGTPTEVYVAPAEGDVVGFVWVGPNREADDEAELYAIYVLPESWGSGAGAALMRAGIDAIGALGYHAASLWVLEDNPRARRFYEREGWSLDGGRKEEEHLGVRVAEVRYRITL